MNNGDGTWSYTPANNDDGAVSFSYSITDGDLSVAGTADLDINPVNDAPVTTAVTLAAIAEDSGARLITQAQLLANASDVDNANLDLLALGLSIDTGNGTLDDLGGGTWSYTPALNDSTGVSFNYVVSDGGESALGTATLDITPVNDAPTTAPVTLAALNEDTARTITRAQLLANAADVDTPLASLTVSTPVITTGLGSLVTVVAATT